MSESSRRREGSITLAVLAGGRGTRMGMPKARLTLKQQPILRWLHRQLDWPGPTMLVTARDIGDAPGGEAFDALVFDTTPGNGPLQGMMDALSHAATPVVVFTTVDMPLVRSAQLFWLAEALVSEPTALGMMGVRRDGVRSIEPFPCALRTTAIELLHDRLLDGRRSVHGLCEHPAVRARPVPAKWPADVWLNLNHPHEFAAFEGAQLAS